MVLKFDKDYKVRDFVDRLTGMVNSYEIDHLPCDAREEYQRYIDDMIKKAAKVAVVKEDWLKYSPQLRTLREAKRLAIIADFTNALKRLIAVSNRLVADVWSDLEDEVDYMANGYLERIACYITLE